MNITTKIVETESMLSEIRDYCLRHPERPSEALREVASDALWALRDLARLGSIGKHYAQASRATILHSVGQSSFSHFLGR
jgi:hypothetical protein